VASATNKPTQYSVNRALHPLPLAPIHPGEQRKLITTSLAQDLPKADKLTPILQAAKLVNTHLTKAALDSVPQIQTIKTLLGRLPSLSLDITRLTPSDIKPLKTAVENSGVFYEPRLKQTLEKNLLETSTPGSSRIIIRDERELKTLADKDLKGLLLQVQSTLTRLSSTTAAPNKIPDAITQLFVGLTSLLTPRQAPGKTPPAHQMISALRELVERSLAGIQTQQFRSLHSQSTDQTNTDWHMDIPLRTPEGYGNMYLHIHQQRIPSEPQEESKTKAKRQLKSRWRLFLELELDDLGKLAAEISAMDKNLGITLWAEQGSLREKANAHLLELKTDLEKQGIILEELRCSSNPPPKQKVQLDYALIDTQT
jgi:hypothetical protein